MSLSWTAFPVATLTVRQHLGGKAARVVAGLSTIPVIFALIYLINPDVDVARVFLVDVIVRRLWLPTLLPITVLITATAAFGNELDDRTLLYLTLKPVPRWRIVLGKFVGTIVVTAPIILLAVLGTSLIVLRGEAGDNLRLVAAFLAATFAGVVAYTAIFLLVSLLVSRALLVGMFYSFIWESVLGRFLPGLRIVSIRHFVESIFVRILQDPEVTLRNAMTLNSAIITLAVVCLAALALASVRLRRLNLE